MRRAIEARDRGCTLPGCDRPPAWCDAHHAARHWADGGITAVHTLTLLCELHHTIVHRDGWTIVFIDGLPWFLPPRWIDPEQRPRLHSRFKTRALDPLIE
jgi:hypothetical protein